MSPFEALRNALESLGAHKLRSVLTMLGTVFGVGAVIAMLAIGSGAEREAMAMIERLGLRNILVSSKVLEGQEAEEARKKSVGLSFRDAEAILDAVPAAEAVSPQIDIDPYIVLAAGSKTDAAVHGVSRRHLELTDLELAVGRFFDALDEQTFAQVCVIDERVRRDLFGFGPALGTSLKVDDVWLEVVGILAAATELTDLPGGAAEGDAAGPRGRIYLPVTTAQRKFDREPLAAPLAALTIRLRQGAGARATAGMIAGLLSRLHAGVDDFELVVPEVLLEQSRRLQRLFNLVMSLIAGISLVVGGIGIMNIMLATVVERTREIGLHRAVGARRRDIVFRFLLEAFTISLIGGLLGILVGFGMARLVATWTGWSTVVTPGAILLATGVAMAVGLAAGIYPARRAAALDPIEALRFE